MIDPKHELLPEELLWAEGGHASDVVLTALGDGQKDIVPLAARAHVEGCSTCMAHLGHASLLSLHTESALKLRAEHEAPPRRPLPRLAIALALVVAGLGLAPSGPGLVQRLTHDLPLFARGLDTIVHRLDEHGGIFVTYGAAALLICMGIGISRLLPKKEAPR